MKKYSLLLAVVFSVGFSVQANAMNVRTATGSVVQVFADSAGGALVTLSTGDRAAGGACTTGAVGRYVVDHNSDGAKGLLAALLTAKAAELQVALDVIDNCASGAGGQPNEFGPVILNVIVK